MIATAHDREALRATQLNSLRALLAEIGTGNRFYAQRLADAGLDAGVESIAGFTARMPFTHKHELVRDQQQHPPYGTALTYPLERYTRFNQTSATSGNPMRWLDTPQSWAWMLDNWDRVYESAGVTAQDRIFFAFSFGPFLGFWTAFESATRRGCLCLPGGGMSSAARVRGILENEVTVLCCTPTYALRLAEVAAAEGIALAGASRVRRLIVAGEPGGSIPATRAQLERLWPGARVVDHHGMTEVGPVSYECPAATGRLHVIESAYLAEIIEPDGDAAVAPGAVGELVLTTLGRLGSPLLRYRTGDLVRAGQNADGCACGTCDLALEGGILGRVDDMLVVRGVNIFPSAIEEVVRRHSGSAEFQLQVNQRDTLHELELVIETPSENAGEDGIMARLETELRAVFNLRIPVRWVEHGTLPRGEMKSRRCIRQ